MEGGIREPGYYALRVKPDIISWPVIEGKRRRVTYNTAPGIYGGLVCLFSVDNAELLAIMNDGFIQHLRVAANAAIGVKYLSRTESRVLGIVGSGGMARSFAKAFAAVRQLELIRVYSPSRAHTDSFVRDVESELACRVVAMPDPESTVRGADIVATCTNSYEPVIHGSWLKPGVHVANVTSFELGPDTCERIEVAGLVLPRTPPSTRDYIDDDFAIRANVMSYAAGSPEERVQLPSTSWEDQGIEDRGERYPNAVYRMCVNWDTGEAFQRQGTEEITTLANISFGTREGDIGPSAGIQGVQFASIGGRIFENAQANGVGQSLPQEMFTQDIPT